MLALTALLISLMYSMNLERRKVVILGIIFLLSVFITYFLSGLGLLEAFSILSLLFIPPHLISRVSAAIMLFVGSANVINYFIPDLIPIYSLLKFFRAEALRYIRIVSFSGITVAGFLVGLHNFPCACTGGIYFTFLSAIANSQFRTIYLLIYNFLFLIPSLTILMISTNKKLVKNVRNWLYRSHRRLRLLVGLLMIFLSLTILISTLY